MGRAGPENWKSDLMSQLIANRYRVLGELGRGNMGAVYRVADTLEGDRLVALKVIQAPGAITPELRLLFKEEFRAMTKLRHPNTISVFGYGELDETSQYLTMEIVPGAELAEVIGGKPMPLDKVYPLLVQLLQALGFIHSRLYVHHDIKAQNIRVRDDGTLKLMDFGLMCQLGRPALGGRVTGTPGYLPPEIARGGVINASTDLYSVGCLAFEMVTGRLPFEGKIGDVIRAHMQEAPPKLRSVRPDAPEALERLVSRLLEKDQERRYQQAADVLSDLAALAGIEVARENMAQRTSYLTTGGLVAREAEMGMLEAALTGAIDGRGGAVFIGAPAGVGKSRLVQELVLHAKLDQVLVAHGHCTDTGMEPYEPLKQAMRVLAPLTTPEERQRFAVLLNKVVPELFPALECPDLPAITKDEEKLIVLESVTEFLRGLTARFPVMLVMDDLHWCDMQSLELFNHLVRQAGTMRLLCVGTFRNDETPPGSPVWYPVEEGAAQHLKLQPFDSRQTTRLIEAMLSANRFTDTCTDFMYGATAGNAFYLTEFLRHLMEANLLVKRDGAWELQGCNAHTPPANVAETIKRRLANLSPGARDLARLASVIGRHQDRETLLATSGLDPETLFVRLDELIERQFIVREEARYAFPHDRVRETLYESIPEPERRVIHQRCGEHLERAFGDSDSHVQDLAHHFRHGADGRKAFTYLKRAGDAAFDTGANGVAVERYLEAEPFLASLDDSEREAASIDLWWDIAGIGFNILPGAAVVAADKLTRALAGPAGAGVAEHTVELIKAYALQATAYGFTGNPTKGLEAADKAMALMPPGQTPLHGSLIMIKVANLFPAGHLDEVAALSAKARPYLVDVDLSGQTGLIFNTRVGAISYPNTCALMGVRPDPARREHALWAVEDGKAYSLINIINAFFGIWAAWTGRAPDAVTYIEESNQYSRKLGAPPYPWPLYLRPYLLWQRGEYADALQLTERALAYPHLDHIELAKQLIVILKGQCHLALGELDAAEAAFSAAEARGREAPMAVVLMRALLAKGELALARRDFSGARAALTEAAALAKGGPSRNPLHEAIAERQFAELALAERQFARARAHLDAALAIVTRPEQDNLIEQAHLHRARGEAYLEQNDAIAAGDSLRKAGDLYQRLKNRHGLHAINQLLGKLHQAPEAPQAAEATPEQRFEHLRGMLMR